MALFSKKTTKEVAEKAPKAAKVKAVKEKAVKAKADSTVPAFAAPVIAPLVLTPHVTEKSSLHNDKHNVYTFRVEKNVTKQAITKAIKNQYKVVPVKVNIVRLPAKEVFARGRFGTIPGIKKALVFLKKGDKIEFAA